MSADRARRPCYLAAVGSALLPGLGQALRGQKAWAAVLFGTAVGLVTLSWAIEHAGGIGAGVFFFLLVALPLWWLQAYQAFLPATENGIPGLVDAARQAWDRAHDLRFLGALFLISAAIDLWIILASPKYSLPFFCLKPTGFLGFLAKAQSPTFHIFIGYGFLQLKRWALFVYLAYAAFGLLNATVNFTCFGIGRIRTVLVISLVIFTGYILMRRHRFAQ
jgi:hypothetical protein